MNLKFFLQRHLFRPVDAASVAIFRIGFGCLMAGDAIFHLMFIPLDAIFVEPTFMFRYYGFEWVPLIGDNIYGVYLTIAIASLGVAFGFQYRTSAAIVALGTAWVFLQDQAQYLNHMYMLILYSVLIIFIPANRYWSLDARIDPGLSSDTLPAWCRLVLILQIEVILIYAGLVKINADWLALEPLGTWLWVERDLPLIGQFFTQEWAVALGAYGVIFLHLVGAPLLMVPRVRLYVLCVYICFHTLNHFVFNIGVFPWATIFVSLVCFDADWPRQLYARFKRQSYSPPSLVGLSPTSERWKTITTVLIGIWFAYQVLMPARNILYEGDVAWNEKGHRFSWRMKLRNNHGTVNYAIVNPLTNKSTFLDISGRTLSARQRDVMACKPDMILQFSHYLRDEVANKLMGIPNAGIYAKALCSLNFRKLADLVDPRVNLATVKRSLGNEDWILPLNVPLEDRIGNGIPPSVRSEM